MEDRVEYIRPSSDLRNKYSEISALCKETQAPVYLTVNGRGDTVLMNMEAFVRREKMLRLREELLAVEESRLQGSSGCSPEQLETYLSNIIDEVSHGKNGGV